MIIDITLLFSIQTKTNFKPNNQLVNQNTACNIRIYDNVGN